MNNKKMMTAQRVHSLGLMDKTLPLTVATPPQLRHRRHFHFNGMHFEANPLALHLARGIHDDAGDTRRWPKAYHNNNNNKATVQQQQSEQQLSGNDNNGHNRSQNWCDDDNKWLNYGQNYGNDCYRQNDYDKAGGGEDVYGGDTNNDYHDHHDHDNQRVQQVMGKGSRQQLGEQDYVNYKSNSNCNCNSISSNSNSNFETNSNSNLQHQQHHQHQQQQVADIYHNYGYQQQKDYEQDREWKQETERERERERERDRECDREQRPRLYNRAAFRPFGQQHQQLLRMAGGFRAAALAAATGNGNRNGNAIGIGIGADQPQMDYITLTGFLLGYLTSNVLFFLCWYFSWLKGQVMRMRKHFLGQSNLWEFFDFEDTTRYSMQTKLLLAPIILVCSILYCVVNVLHLLIKLVRADVPRTVVDLVQRIAKSHWP